MRCTRCKREYKPHSNDIHGRAVVCSIADELTKYDLCPYCWASLWAWLSKPQQLFSNPTKKSPLVWQDGDQEWILDKLGEQ